MEQVIARQGDTVDLICYRQYGDTSAVETVYAENPGLAEHGPVLPSGTRVRLPARSQRRTRETVKLWD